MIGVGFLRIHKKHWTFLGGKKNSNNIAKRE